MKRLTFLFVLACLMLTSLPALAWEEDEDNLFWWETQKPRKWSVSFAPGFGMLLLKDSGTVKNGFGGHMGAGYRFTPNWELDLRLQLGVYDGDTEAEQGIYSLFGVLAGGRYYFMTDTIQPYVYFGMGYLRSEYDIEMDRRFATHSLLIEPGGGVLFGVSDWFYGGAELAMAPVLFGNDAINGSFLLHAQLLLEFRF